MDAVLEKPAARFRLEGKLTDKSFYLPGVFTFEEYLDLHEDNLYSEWIDGKVFIMAAASVAHQRIGSFLEKVMGIYVETKQIGEVFRAPIAVKVNIFAGREPDVFFIKKENLHIVKPTFIKGAPDLAVEIISPESVERDTVDKFGEYERAGVKELWLIDPDNRKCDFYELADGHFRLMQTMSEGVFRSKAVEGFFFRVEYLWLMESPTLEALKELNLL
ncbi:MAG: Uma2 family endonuclease [Pyrinomonadaceae bacterium]